MSDIIEIQHLTTAVLELLRDQSGNQVYDHVAPDDRPSMYGVVYSIPGGEYYGAPLTDPEADVEKWYQVNAVGKRRDQAEWLADKFAAILVGRTNGALTFPLPLPTNVAECDRMRTDVPGGVEQEGIAPNAVFTVSQRFAISVTPSTS